MSRRLRHLPMRRAILVSAIFLTLLIAVEYAAILYFGSSALVTPQTNHITHFGVSRDGLSASFVVTRDAYRHDRRNGEAVDRRVQLGFMDTACRSARRMLWTLPSTPATVQPCDCRNSVIVMCRDGRILEVKARDRSRPGTGQMDAREVATIDSNGRVDVAYDRQHDTIIVRDVKRGVCAMNADTGQQRWSIDVTGIRSIALDDRTGRLYCGFVSGEIVQVSTDTGRVSSAICKRAEDVRQLRVSPCGQYLAAAHVNGQLQYIRLTDCRLLWSRRIDCRTRLTFTTDGERLVAAGYGPRDEELHLIDSCNGNVLQILGRHDRMKGIAAMADGSVYSWSEKGTIIAWHPGSSAKPVISRPGVETNWMSAIASMGDSAR